MKKKISFFFFLALLIGILFYFYSPLYKATCNLLNIPDKERSIEASLKSPSLKEGLRLLKIRKDREAMVVFEGILAGEPDNVYALWGKAEVLRRARHYNESESLLNEILDKDPGNNSSLLSLCYIRYKQGNLNEALKLLEKVLRSDALDRENEALAYMMLGTINSARSKKSWIFNKLRYGTQVKCYFLKALDLAPDLPEVHLGLGSFYLMAPGLVGGDLDRAIEELKTAVSMAPDFATANARLAQAYKRKGEINKFKFYFERAKELDPENEALIEF